MANYSVTLNFFIPTKIVQLLKKVDVGKIDVDWRSEVCHCTVKSIALSDRVPSKKILENWVHKAQDILQDQPPFMVKVADIGTFPNIIFAKVHSPNLVALHRRLGKVLPSGQPQFEGDTYVPHVSIGMAKKISSPNISNTFGTFTVKEIQLVIWDLKNLNKPIISHTFTLV